MSATHLAMSATQLNIYRLPDLWRLQFSTKGNVLWSPPAVLAMTDGLSAGIVDPTIRVFLSLPRRKRALYIFVSGRTILCMNAAEDFAAAGAHNVCFRNLPAPAA